MIRFVTAIVVATLMTGMVNAANAANTANAPKSIDQLLKQIHSDGINAAKVNKKREQKFRAIRGDKAALLKRKKEALLAEEKRGERLSKTFADNTHKIAQLKQDRKLAQGDLGEMFGVVKGEAGSFAGNLAASNISAQYPGRDKFIAGLGARQQLPKIGDLEKFWEAQLFEMAESGKIVKFNGSVTGIDGAVHKTTVTRIGSYNLLADGQYVVYNPDLAIIQQLSQQPGSAQVASVESFTTAKSGVEKLFVDPARGALLNVFTQKPTIEERIEAGGVIGYIIIGLLIIGGFIAIERLITLYRIGIRVKAQRNDVDNPGDNPLGRVLKAYQQHQNVDVETLELKLDEAILKETPALEARISIIKVIAAIAPMMGLLGTVTGMIATFQSIQLFGTGDPKLMAGGISMALMTTVEGLVAALPLILMHTMVLSRSRSVVQILDEQSAGLVAAHAEKKGI